jgi:hypothetical protein
VKFYGTPLSFAFLFYAVSVIVGEPWAIKNFLILGLLFAIQDFLFHGPAQVEFQSISKQIFRRA